MLEMRGKNYLLVLLAGLLMFTVLMIGGCSQKPAANTSTSGNFIPIGILRAYTGIYAGWTPTVVNSMMLAVNEINSNGGVLGKQLKVFTADDECTSTGGIQGAHMLVDTDKVVCIVGPESDPMVALLDFAKQNKVPIITTNAGTTVLDKVGGPGTYIWRDNPGDTYSGVAEAKVMFDELGIKNASVLYTNNSSTAANAQEFIKNFQNLGGTIFDKEALNAGQQTYYSELSQIFAKNPQSVYLSVDNTTGVAIMKEAYERGYKTQWLLSNDLTTDEIIKAGVAVTQGALSVAITEDPNTSEYKAFAAAYEQAYKDKPQPGWYESNSYDAVILTALAMDAAKSATGPAIDSNIMTVTDPSGVKVSTYKDGVAALQAGKKIKYIGASGSLDFDQYGNVGAAQATLMSIENGHWVNKQTYQTSQMP